MTIPYKENVKTVAIVGGASGLGKAISLIYALRGWEIAILDSDPNASKSTVSQITEMGVSAKYYPINAADAAAWPATRESLQSRWEHLDLLINCAASLCVGETGKLPLESHQATIDVTLSGTVFACETLAPWMRQNPRSAHIVNVASCASFLGMPWSASYNAAKAGVVAYSETLFTEFADGGVGITVACPGFFASHLFANADYSDDELEQTVGYVVGKSTVDATAMAESICRAVDRRQLYVYAPARVWRLWWMKRLVPHRLLRSISQKSRRLRRRFAASK